MHKLPTILLAFCMTAGVAFTGAAQAMDDAMGKGAMEQGDMQKNAMDKESMDKGGMDKKAMHKKKHSKKKAMSTQDGKMEQGGGMAMDPAK